MNLLQAARLTPSVNILIVGECGEYGDSGTHQIEISRKEILSVIKGRYNLSDLNNWEDIRSAFLESEDQAIDLLSIKDFEKKRADQSRRKLEKKASKIARTIGSSIDSFEFIQACYQALDRLKDYRDGMREDGLCIGYGVSYSEWEDEYNCSQSDTSNIREILDWLESECPLLMAKFRNHKIAERMQ